MPLGAAATSPHTNAHTHAPRQGEGGTRGRLRARPLRGARPRGADEGGTEAALRGGAATALRARPPSWSPSARARRSAANLGSDARGATMGLLAKYFGACACLGGGDAAGAAASPAADTAGADGEGGKKKAARDDEGAGDADALAGGWDRSPRRRRTTSSASARGQQEVDGELFYDALAVSQRSGSLMGVGSSGSVGASLSSFTRTVSAAGGAMAGTVASAARAGGLLSVNEETGAHSLHVPGEEQAKRLAKIATRAVLGKSEASKQRARARMELREAKDVEALRVEVIKRGGAVALARSRCARRPVVPSAACAVTLTAPSRARTGQRGLAR